VLPKVAKATMKAKMSAISQHDIADVFAYKLCKCTKALTCCYEVIAIMFYNIGFSRDKKWYNFPYFILMSTAKNLFVFSFH
jgi:hypothetical protein